jgi:hypothetical protein
MKKMTISLILLLFGFQSFSQAPPGSAGSKDYYLQKSKNQKKTGWILLAAGTVMAVGGGIGFGNNWDLFQNNTKADIYGSIMVGGIVADLVSIPIFISSGRNARRGARISVSSQLIDIPRGNNSYVKQHPTISVKIPF